MALGKELMGSKWEEVAEAVPSEQGTLTLVYGLRNEELQQITA